MSDDPLSQAYLTIRTRTFELRDRIDELMRVETATEQEIQKLSDQAASLSRAVQTLTEIGDDVTSIDTRRSQVCLDHAAAMKNLNRTRDELALVRDAYTHFDEAYDSLHWGRFADSRLRTFQSDPCS